MATTTASKTKRRINTRKGVVVSSEVKDYSNDPFFVKKAEEAEAFLNKHGLPKELVKK